MNKYRKYRKKSKSMIKNPYILFFVFIIGISVMGVGYSSFSKVITIDGVANANYITYEIKYNLNGGQNPENVVEKFRIIDDIILPIPTKTNYKFCGWYEDEDFVGEKIINTKNIDRNLVLYAKWEKSNNNTYVYKYDGEYVFTGSNYIDTGVYLYSKENLNKNFLISFDIVRVDECNVNHSALMNSMDESGKPWSGHVVKVSVSGKNKSVKFESNSNTSSTGDVYISQDVKNVRILRMNNKLYYSFDGNDFIIINNFNGFTDTFDVPVTFGASMDGNHNPFRFFTGTLSNMSVSFVDEDEIIEGYNSKEKELKIVYEHKGEYIFDGESSYINTGLCFFSRENIEKDFEISLDIDYVGQQVGSQNVIINAKNESINSYPAFVYRLYQARDGTIRFESKGGTGSGAVNKISEVKKVKISRIKSKIYLTINSGETKEVYDFSNFNNYFNVPLTIGAALDANGNPFRFFNGILSNIVIKAVE